MTPKILNNWHVGKDEFGIFMDLVNACVEHFSELVNNRINYLFGFDVSA